MKRILVAVLCVALLVEGATLLVFRRGAHPPGVVAVTDGGGADLARAGRPWRPPSTLAPPADAAAETFTREAEEQPPALRRGEKPLAEPDRPKGPDPLARCLACATSEKGAFCRCDRNCVACNLKVPACDQSRINDFFAQARACTCLMNRCPDDCPVKCF